MTWRDETTVHSIIAQRRQRLLDEAAAMRATTSGRNEPARPPEAVRRTRGRRQWTQRIVIRLLELLAPLASSR